MSYGVWEFVEDIVAALNCEPPGDDEYDPSECSDLALEAISKLQRAESILRIVQADTRAAFQKADDAWGAELQRLFGKNAGEVRYTDAGKGKRGSPLRHRYNEREAARIAHDRSMGRAEDGSELEGVK